MTTDPFEVNKKIIDVVRSRKGRPKGRITVGCTFVATESPGWYVVSVTIAGLPDDRKPQYDVFLYVGEEAYYDVDRNMTINPQDYFVAEAQDGVDADTVIIDKAMKFSIINDVVAFHRKKGK